MSVVAVVLGNVSCFSQASTVVDALHGREMAADDTLRCLHHPLKEHSVYPLNWSCLYHVFTTGCLYIYYVHLPNAGYVQPLLFPIPFRHTTLSSSPLSISTRPTSSRWVPPYVPWFCLRFLPD